MQDRIEAYLKTKPDVWISAAELSEKLNVPLYAVLHGTQRLLCWRVVEKRYIDTERKRGNMSRSEVFVRLKK